MCGVFGTLMYALRLEGALVRSVSSSQCLLL